jgi:hypothetical protein
MNRNFKQALIAFALVAGASLSVSQIAQAQDLDGGGLPQELHQGDLTFITGGVGLDESQALRQAAPHWPLAMRFTGSGSDYLADVHVQVTDGKGATILQADSRGPYMLVRLRPGHYTVQASYEGHAQTRALTIKRGAHEKLDFSWNQS